MNPGKGRITEGRARHGSLLGRDRIYSGLLPCFIWQWRYRLQLLLKFCCIDRCDFFIADIIVKLRRRTKTWRYSKGVE